MSKVPLDGQKTIPEAICDLIGEEIRRFQEAQEASEQLLALVVGVPAITNVEEGIVLSVSTLEDWRLFLAPIAKQTCRLPDHH